MRLPTLLPLLAALLAVACKTPETPIDTSVEPPDEEPLDNDGDGSPAEEDCDDDDPAVNPSAAEACDGKDNNCDGAIDEGALITVYTDADGDGFGDDTTAAEACAPAEGEVTVGGDCDDGDARYNPDAAEDDCADPNDYNCDGSTGYADGDGDGFAACEDCDDNDAGTSPAATEICDDLDNNCDGLTDENVTETWWQDKDGDLYGDPDFAYIGCSQPEGYIDNVLDCDDGDSGVNPAADELCDGLDNNCDGVIDGPDALDPSTYYTDADGDGYGDASAPVTGCEAPSGAVASSDDCDDDDLDSYPGAAEACDNADNDCDSDVDEEVCACTFMSYGGHEYLFCEEGANWDQAYVACLSYGYDLVAITDAAEDAWVWSAAYGVADTDWWIGLNDHTTEGAFVWTTGEATSYTGWSPGEPNNSYFDGSAENCVHLGWYAPTGLWNDFGCYAENYFICEG